MGAFLALSVLALDVVDDLDDVEGDDAEDDAEDNTEDDVWVVTGAVDDAVASFGAGGEASDIGADGFAGDLAETLGDSFVGAFGEAAFGEVIGEVVVGAVIVGDDVALAEEEGCLAAMAFLQSECQKRRISSKKCTLKSRCFV